MELFELDDLKSDANSFFKGPSIYFLFQNDALMYIGCSINFLSRIGMHASGRNAKKFDSYRVIRVPDGVDMFDLEFRYIVKFRPPLNSFPPKRGTEGNPVSTRKTKTERICEMKLLSARHHKAFSEILGTEPLE